MPPFVRSPLLALAAGLLLGACDTTGVVEQPGLRQPILDTGRADGAVTLRWSVWVDPMPTLGPPAEEPPRPTAVEVLASTEHPDALVRIRTVPVAGERPEFGAVTVGELPNGTLHYFAVRFVGAEGLVSARSNVVAVVPAPPEAVEAVLPSGLLGGAWSPTGEALAFSTPAFGEPLGQEKLVLYDLATGGTRRLTFPDRPDLDALFPTWSPDGSRIAFTGETGYDGNQVFVVDLATDSLTQLTSTPALRWAPAWSPTGTHIAFTVRQDEPVHRLALTPTAGGATAVLTSGPGNATRPSWSADGARLFYEGECVQADGTREALVLAVPATGGAPEVVVGPEWQPGLPAASPDGRRLAFTSARSGHAEVWTLDLATGAFHQHTGTTARRAAASAWSPDGGRLLVTAAEEDYAYRSYVIRLE